MGSSKRCSLNPSLTKIKRAPHPGSAADAIRWPVTSYRRHIGDVIPVTSYWWRHTNSDARETLELQFFKCNCYYSVITFLGLFIMSFQMIKIILDVICNLLNYKLQKKTVSCCWHVVSCFHRRHGFWLLWSCGGRNPFYTESYFINEYKVN